jgi:hypothetical protein
MGRLPERTTGNTLPDMFTRLRADTSADVVAFRDHVHRLGRHDRRDTEAARVRVMLARSSRVGLRERLDRAAEATTISGMRRDRLSF